MTTSCPSPPPFASKILSGIQIFPLENHYIYTEMSVEKKILHYARFTKMKTPIIEIRDVSSKIR